MATRSFIVQRREDGYYGVYAHWDGYPEWNGRLLLQHYQDAKKVAALIDTGDISILRKEVGKKHDFDWQYKLRQYIGRSRRESPQEFAERLRKAEQRHPVKLYGWTTFYGRDRGEGDTEARHLDTLFDAYKYAQGMGAEYLYLFTGGEWYVYPVSWGAAVDSYWLAAAKRQMLTPALCGIEEA